MSGVSLSRGDETIFLTTGPPGSPSRVSLTVLLERCTVCDPAFGLSALRIMQTFARSTPDSTTRGVDRGERQRHDTRIAKEGRWEHHEKKSEAGGGAKPVGAQKNVGAQTEGRWGRPLFTGWLFFCGRQTAEEKLAPRENRGYFLSRGGESFFFVSQTPASEMGTGNSASHLRVCRTNLDG